MRLRPAYYLVSSATWFANAIPMAITVLLAQSRGMDLARIGLYLGLYSLTVVLLELPSGALADAWGRKRVFLVAGCVGLAAKAAFLLAFDLPAFLLFALLLGASRALASGALEAWFVDALQAAEPDADLQPPLARAGAWNLLALAAGTLLGSALPNLTRFLPQTPDAILTPLSSTLVASIIAAAAALLVTLLVIRERPGAAPVESAGASLRSGLTAFRHVIADAAKATRADHQLLLLLGAELVAGVALTASENLWQPFFALRLASADADGTFPLGVIMAGSFGMGVLGNFVATPLVRRLNGRYALVAALFQGLQGLAFLALAAQGGLAGATAFYWCTYVARSAWSSPQATLFHLRVPAARRSVMLSLQSLVWFGGSFVGSVLLGPLAEATSIPVAWSTSGLLLLAAVGLYRPLLSMRHQGPDGAGPEGVGPEGVEPEKA